MVTITIFIIFRNCDRYRVYELQVLRLSGRKDCELELIMVNIRINVTRVRDYIG